LKCPFTVVTDNDNVNNVMYLSLKLYVVHAVVAVFNLFILFPPPSNNIPNSLLLHTLFIFLFVTCSSVRFSRYQFVRRHSESDLFYFILFLIVVGSRCFHWAGRQDRDDSNWADVGWVNWQALKVLNLSAQNIAAYKFITSIHLTVFTINLQFLHNVKTVIRSLSIYSKIRFKCFTVADGNYTKTGYYNATSDNLSWTGNERWLGKLNIWCNDIFVRS